MTTLETLPALSAKEAYLAMLEFLQLEFELAGSDGTVHLGGLIAEMMLEEDGESSDPGGVLQFADAVARVVARR